MNVALYARVACTLNSEYNSLIENQLIEIRDYAINNQHIITGEYIDVGEGSYSNLPPELRRLISDIACRTKNIDAIIVRERSRLTRNILYQLMIDELLVKKRVRLISVRECNIPIPSFIFESIIKWKN